VGHLCVDDNNGPWRTAVQTYCGNTLRGGFAVPHIGAARDDRSYAYDVNACWTGRASSAPQRSHVAGTAPLQATRRVVAIGGARPAANGPAGREGIVQTRIFAYPVVGDAGSADRARGARQLGKLIIACRRRAGHRRARILHWLEPRPRRTPIVALQASTRQWSGPAPLDTPNLPEPRRAPVSAPLVGFTTGTHREPRRSLPCRPRRPAPPRARHGSAPAGSGAAAGRPPRRPGSPRRTRPP